MKRIIIIGCPGSGKSTFARALHSKTGIPLYHLDMMYWNADRSTVEKSVFLERLSDVLKCDEWIIDGNYASTMEQRIAACDTVFLLDYPTEVCLDGVRQRRGNQRSDMPWVELEEDEEFVGFIRKFNELQRPQIFKIFELYPDKCITVFRSRAEADSFLHDV